MTDHRGSDEPVDQETRDQALSRDDWRQFCGVVGPTRGGYARLEIHHKERNPDHMEEHDLKNLVTLCRHCHGWFHRKPTADDVETEPCLPTGQNCSRRISRSWAISNRMAPPRPAR
ncbi:HNH endonuclease [Haloarcula halobia]|uniref:HNH endonuclease n=1 Tax=Haloarcula halobia TaxID=3033388 RepID=UPI0023EBC19A|nr:HNH endonuclease signature motif containing protein [Halomicroarcula sp. XH51]